jgi:hypothetical protein
MYDWEGHGFTDAAAREDFMARLVAFLHANLDAAPGSGGAIGAASPR